MNPWRSPLPRQLSRRLVLAAAFVGLPTAVAAMSPLEAQRALGGTWVGDGTVLRIDTLRLQVNLDPDKPFEWRPFRLADVSGSLVTFMVGSMPYVALFANRTSLVLTSPSFVGQRSLRLQP